MVEKRLFYFEQQSLVPYFIERIVYISGMLFLFNNTCYDSYCIAVLSSTINEV